MDGEREPSDAWTGFTRFVLPKGKATRRIHMVRGETRKQTTSRPDDVWPDFWKHMSDAAKKKAKQRWTIEKPKLDKPDNALQNTDKEQWRNPPQNWEAQDKIRLCCRCRRMYETKAGGAGHKPHQDHIVVEGMNCVTRWSLVHKFIPMLEASKIP